MNSEIEQSRSRRLTISNDDQSLEDRLDAALKISPNLTPEFDDDDDQEFEGKISDFPERVYKDGGNDSIKTDDVSDKTTSVSAPSSCLIAQDETPNISSSSSSSSSSLASTLGQLDAASDDDNDGFKTPTDAAHRIPPPTECPPAPKIKKRPNYDSTAVNSAVRPIRRCRRKLLFDNGFDLMARLKINNKERLPR